MSDLLDKISSKYLLLKIFEYIKKERILKLFAHSKKYIEKLGLLFHYQYNYLKVTGINLFYFYYLTFSIVDGKINKEILNNRFKEDIKDLDININFTPEFLINFHNEFIKHFSCNYNIDIYSPLFENLSKTALINEFSIIIQMNIIKKSNFFDDYISTFKKLNEIKSNYSSILFKYENLNDINYLNKFNINFSQIKMLHISDSKYSTGSFRSKDKIKHDEKSFNSLTTIFTHNDIKNNLIYLHLDSYDTIEIKNNLFEPLNDFKVLKSLSLNHFVFENSFFLKIKDLLDLELIFCENISFENCCLNLIKLRLNDSHIITPKSLLQLPNLKSCDLCYYSKINYNILIDFKSLKKLEKFSAHGKYFLDLENNSLNVAECYFNDINDTISKNILNKLISFKYLNNLYLNSFNMNINEISKIEGSNNSIVYLLIENQKKDGEINLDFLQKKFPNLLSFYLKNCHFNHDLMDLEIKENKNCKINDIVIDCKFGQNKKIKMFCQSYETLKYLGIYIEKICDLKKVIPIFNEKCEIKFNSLIIFSFISEEYETNFDVLKNIYNNIDKMPILRKIIINCFCSEVNEEFYAKFVEKILSLNLDSCEIKIRLSRNDLNTGIEKKYSIKELNDMKKIYPKFKSLNFNKIVIHKLKLK